MEEAYQILGNSGVQDWLREGLILIVDSGSRAYGTATKESDTDFKGIVIPPLEYHVGLKKFEHFVAGGDTSRKNTADDVDLTLYSLKKFVTLGMNSNPHILEMLFVDDDNIRFQNDFGKELIDNRDLFVSNRIMRSFGGFAIQNQRRIEQDAIKREIGWDSYDYDRKTAAHSVRIYQQAIELFTSGTMSTKRPNANELMEIRKGKYSYLEMLTILNDLNEEFSKARDDSTLQDRPSQNKIEKLLIHLTMTYLKLK